MNAVAPSPNKPSIIAIVATAMLFLVAAHAGLTRAEHAYQIGRV